MAIALGMKEIAREIASSQDRRAKRIGEIRADAKQVREEAGNLLKGLRVSREQERVRLVRELSEDKRSRKSKVSGLLGEFRTSRRQGGALRRKDLASGVSERRSGVKELLKELGQARWNTKLEVGKLRNSAESLIKSFSEVRRESSRVLKGDLARSKAEITSEVKQMRTCFCAARADVRADLDEAASAWQEFAKSMQVKRAGAKAPPKSGITEAEKAEPPAVREEAEALRADEEIPDLETKLLSAINECPEGITLSEVAEKLGVMPIVLGRASKNLLGKGLIRKEEKLYFPVARE